MEDECVSGEMCGYWKFGNCPSLSDGNCSLIPARPRRMQDPLPGYLGPARRLDKLP
jgi:hypothetical protein